MKKNRKKTNVLVGTLAVLLGVTGTFAWQSISQHALNVKAGEGINPGGRLHDDFNGTNKDVYVENFTKKDDQGENIFARIRLREYMEVGEDAGKKLDQEQSTRNVTSINADAKYKDKSTWKVFKMEETSEQNKIRNYFELKFGGETTYMPTFNMNKDSLSADINGTYEGSDNDASAGTAYDDYVDYSEEGNETKTDTEYYDADSNDVAEDEPLGKGDTGTEGENHTKQESQTHTAKKTMQSTIMSMEDWKDGGSEPGPYWVYDSDGWFYWALPIEPETATGLMLDEVVAKASPTEKWYYTIDVQGQFVTGDDIGTGTAGEADPEGTGFYKDGFTPDAETMMKKVTAVNYEEMDPLEKQARQVVGTTNTIEIDGIDWYVLAMQGQEAMVWAKDPIEKKAFDDSNNPKWETSTLKTYLNGTWLTGKNTLNTKAVAKSFKTREAYNSETFVQSTDKVFLLSEADVYGTFDGKAEKVKPDDYTYKGKQLVTNVEIKKSATGTANYSWLRSPRGNALSVTVVGGASGNLNNFNANVTYNGVRPALWLNLAS